ncbi:MAG TPA: hypothetical protein VGS11_05345 [Candidatus Bathyarchaeia archaeon]|nr:hypothetical protein [Candidatus Bathyarchaeia archaeon]
MQISPGDLNWLSSNGYVTAIPKSDYDQAQAEVSTLSQMDQNLANEMMADRAARDALRQDTKKTHSIMFHFKGGEEKDAERQKVQQDWQEVLKDETEITATGSRIKELILKKSTMDRMVPYDGQYVSLTGPGVIALSDLNIRNYRVMDDQFPDFIAEMKATAGQLQSIANQANSYEYGLKQNIFQKVPMADFTQVWNVAIGLAKLQGDPNQISQRFLLALDVVRHFKSTSDNKIMVAEIMTSLRPMDNPSFSTDNNSDLQNLSQSLKTLDDQLRHHAHVPKQLSAGVAATIMYGRKFDGTFPTDRFVQFSKMTKSFESAAILSVMNVRTDQLAAQFQSYRNMFTLWGFRQSEDTELASAYLALSGLGPDEVRTKLSIIVEGMRSYLQYPLVAAAILTSIPTLEANELLDLTERAYSLLALKAPGLDRSELLSLSIRMIHGVKNELVKQLNPTARLANTPIQFTNAPIAPFFLWYAPLIIVHGSYYSTFSGIGGVHPAHVHGYGGGGFGG